MSDLASRPEERVCASDPSADGGIQLLDPRDVPLGGPRAMSVRRTLPQRARSLIGAWCFVDHYGPDDVAATGGMHVPPHPHTGLQTVTWLFEGEIEHRDSTGAHELVRPGELNLMTAGRGVQHSEYATPGTTRLHGVQLWVALPAATRERESAFEHVAAAETRIGDARALVFVGALAGAASPATAHTPLVGAQLDLPAGGRAELPVDARFEHGLLVDAGSPTVDGVRVPRHALAYAAPGRATLAIEAGDEPVRAVLIGGAPLREQIVMWWNFVGRSHDEIAAFREEWQSAGRRFGSIDDPQPRLPAPELPNVRLRPRD